MTEVATASATSGTALPPLAAPSSNLGLVSVFKRRYLLKLLVQREISARYERSFLGFLWSYINPLTQFFIYWYIMGIVMGAHATIQNYPVHVFSGLIIVHFFTETFGSGTASIMRNKSLVQKMPLPQEMFPVAAMLVSLWHVLPQLAILLVVCILTGWHPDMGTLIGGLLSVAILMMLGTALALIFSVANVFWRDFGSLVGILNNFVRFGCTMIYSYDQLSQHAGSLQPVVLGNPIAVACLLFQRAFWALSTDHPHHVLKTEFPPHLYRQGLEALAASLVILLFAQWFFSKFQARIPEQF
ncbi:ABC transporter permease [Nocardioides sp.]|jgi:ABC-2 type transport system permease protein|uniref:ABC transporter permease n=1 Tax=Nocardioides sp. TaxID=35761 RepID=UPI002CA5F32B|nr:ABC transporter permease [Nocardioides sp.]HVX53398.1 ABC transporter permease [Nocardioides sp.]